jgi:mRNA interferase MazF
VYWYNPEPVRGSEQAGRRPAVLVSRDAVNRASPVVVVVPLTTDRGRALHPSDVRVTAPDGGLARDSIALALHVRSIGRSRLGSCLGRLGQETLTAIDSALARVLDFAD